MKILFLASYAPSIVAFRGDLIAKLVGEGHQVTVCSPPADGFDPSTVEALGANWARVSLERTSTGVLAQVQYLRSLRRILRAHEWDAVLAYTIKPIVFGIPAARSAGIPRRVALVTGLGYMFIEGAGRESVTARLVRRLYRRACGKATHVVFQNADDRELFTSTGLAEAAKCHLVNGSGVNLEHFSVAELPRETTFLMCARIIREKGVAEFLDAVRMLREKHPGVKVIYAGGFEHGSPAAYPEADFLQAVKDLDIDYRGHVKDVRSVIREASVYVLPSYREGTPRSVLEAAAMGRAVITTNGPGGCRHTVVEGSSGILVPPRDGRALGEAMMQFLEQPELDASYGAAGRRHMEDRFDVVKVNERMLDFVIR